MLVVGFDVSFFGMLCWELIMNEVWLHMDSLHILGSIYRSVSLISSLTSSSYYSSFNPMNLLVLLTDIVKVMWSCLNVGKNYQL